MEAVYLICLEPNEHILRKAYRLAYRFDYVKIVTSTECTNEKTSANNIETVSVSQYVRDRFQTLESTRLSFKYDFIGRGDLAEKRTFVIQDAVNNQYRKILIIDDDIWPIPEVHRKIFENTEYEIGGQPPLKQPDLSAIERIDQSSKTFHNNANGNYLYLKIDKFHPFFPRIYNEDWIFLDSIENGINLIIFEDDYRIFQSRKNIQNSDRAYFEEFGEFVIDILLTARQGNLLISKDIANQLYFNRQSYLTRLAQTATGADCAQAVEAALRALDMFDPSFALDYIRVVRADMARWQYT